jgi:hypothetical protein
MEGVLKIPAPMTMPMMIAIAPDRDKSRPGVV